MRAVLFLLLFFSVSCFASASPKVIYEIFTRSFQDSQGTGHGDLAGVTSHLDYIKGLGADAIWLTPVFPSPSYHGYDATDFKSISPDFGDLSTFATLIKEAHARGLKVLLDMAVNHTSTQHLWFKSSASATTSLDRSLYLWSPSPLDWPKVLKKGKRAPADYWHLLNGEYYFASFGSGSFADLNWYDDRVLSRIEDIFDFWVSLGVDGFRLDAAKYLIKGPQGEQNRPETHAIWQQIVSHVHAHSPNTFFVGEVWDSAANIASYYGGGQELTAAFDFPLEGALRTSLTANQSSAFFSSLQEQLSTYQSPFFAAPFCGNHDMQRIATAVGETNKLKLAAAAIFTLPGPVTIYYGDEIGLPQSSATGDLGQRAPMQWTSNPSKGFTTGKTWNAFATQDANTSVAAQDKEASSLLNVYRKLGQLRQSHKALMDGALNHLESPTSNVVSYWRMAPGLHEAVLVVLNFGTSAIGTLIVPVPSELTGLSMGAVIFGGGSAVVEAGNSSKNVHIKIGNLAPSSAIVIDSSTRF